jgi:hypothetical protein
MSKHWINVNTGYMEIYIYCDKSDEANLMVLFFLCLLGYMWHQHSYKVV